MKIKTTKEIDVATYSAKEDDMCKLLFDNIKVSDNINAQSKIIEFDEYAVTGVIENEVPVFDEDGNPTTDEDGNPITELTQEDDLRHLRNVSEVVSYEQYNAIANAILANLPKELSETQKQNAIIQEGIKLFIVNEGYYRGVLTLEDFE